MPRTNPEPVAVTPDNQAEFAARLRDGGGGGTFGGMEVRIAKLEVQMDRALDDLKGLKTDAAGLRQDTSDFRVSMATLAERMAHLPSKEFIVKAVLGVGAILSAVTMFAPSIQKLLGITH